MPDEPPAEFPRIPAVRAYICQGCGRFFTLPKLHMHLSQRDCGPDPGALLDRALRAFWKEP